MLKRRPIGLLLIALAAVVTSTCTDELTFDASAFRLDLGLERWPDSTIVGEAVVLRTTLTDDTGNQAREVSLRYSSSDTAILWVDTVPAADSVGVRVLRPGSATITVRLEGHGYQPAEASGEIQTLLAGVRFTEAADTVSTTAIRDTVVVRARGHGLDDLLVDGVGLEWTTPAPAVLALIPFEGGDSARVVAEAVGLGMVEIRHTRCATGDCSATLAFRATQVPAAVGVGAAVDTLAALGDTATLTVVAVDRNGYAVPGLSFEWSSSDGGVLAVDLAGRVEAKRNGSAWVRAALDGMADSVQLVVRQGADSVEIVSGDGQGVKSGEKLPESLVVRVRDANGHAAAGVDVSWSTTEGALSGGSTVTDSLGLARVEWTLPATPGAVHATAAAGTDALASFMAHSAIAVVQPETGGTVDSEDAAVTVQVAEQALESQAPIYIKPLEELPDSALVVARAAYEFGPDGTQFTAMEQLDDSTSVSRTKLTMRYDPATLSAQPDSLASSAEEVLRISKLVDGRWVELQTEVDTAANTLTARISSFSKYAMTRSEIRAYPVQYWIAEDSLQGLRITALGTLHTFAVKARKCTKWRWDEYDQTWNFWEDWWVAHHRTDCEWGTAVAVRNNYAVVSPEPSTHYRRGSFEDTRPTADAPVRVYQTISKGWPASKNESFTLIPRAEDASRVQITASHAHPPFVVDAGLWNLARSNGSMTYGVEYDVCAFDRECFAAAGDAVKKNLVSYPHGAIRSASGTLTVAQAAAATVIAKPAAAECSATAKYRGTNGPEWSITAQPTYSCWTASGLETMSATTLALGETLAVEGFLTDANSVVIPGVCDIASASDDYGDIAASTPITGRIEITCRRDLASKYAAVRWTTSDRAIVRITPGNSRDRVTLTAAGPGVATVRVTYTVGCNASGCPTGASTHAASFSISVPPANMHVRPADVTFDAAGDSVQLTAWATDEHGDTIRTPAPWTTWTDKHPTSSWITISADGWLKNNPVRGAVLPGESYALLDFLGAQVTVPVTVRPLADSIKLVASPTMVTSPDDSVVVTAFFWDRNGYRVLDPDSLLSNSGFDVDTIHWTNTDTSVIALTDAYPVRNPAVTSSLVVDKHWKATVWGRNEGVATVKVYARNPPGLGDWRGADSIAIPVSWSMTGVRIGPGESQTLTALGDTVALTAQAVYSNGRLVDTVATWSSTAPAVASVTSDGRLAAVANGQAGIVATVDGIQDTFPIVVRQVPASIETVPALSKIVLHGLNDAVPLMVVVKDSGGNVIPRPGLSMRTIDNRVAGADTSGAEVTIRGGLLYGDATLSISAYSDAARTGRPVTRSIPITVDGWVPAQVTVTAHESTWLNALTDTVGYTAVVKDAAGNGHAAPTVAWTSSDLAVATVVHDGRHLAWSAVKGLATATGNGTAQIIATSGDASGTADITVRQLPWNGFELARNVDTLAVGQVAPIRINASDANGHPITDNTIFKFAAWDPRVATVDTAGVVTAVGPGTTTLEAQFGEFAVYSDQQTIVVIDGRILFASNRDGDHEIYALQPNGSGLTQVTNNAAMDLFPAWSPDREKIAFVSDRDGNNEIYVMNADGSSVVRLTDNESSDSQPVWSPDGTRIAFHTNRHGNGNYEIYAMNADGSNQTRLTANTNQDFGPDWSPDGQRMTFYCYRGETPQICVMNADGSGQVQLTTGGSNMWPTWSPDGTRILFYSDRISWQGVFWLMDPDGSNLTLIPNGKANDKLPAWSLDGTKIVFQRRFGSNDASQGLAIMNVDGSGQIILINDATAVETTPDW